MERIIKFRGKRVDEGGWIYGDFCNYKFDGMDETLPCIHIGNLGYIKNAFYQVDLDTVGQFTGLHDRNGKEIYEGDIVMQRGYSGVKPMVVRFEQGAFIVGWHGGSSTQTRPMLIQKRCEVIGNRFDTPNLLNGK